MFDRHTDTYRKRLSGCPNDLPNELRPSLDVIGTIVEQISAPFSLGGDNFKRYFDQR